MAPDSLDVVELVMEIERQFGQDLEDEALERIKLPADVTVGMICRALTRRDARPAPNDPEWQRLTAIIARVCGMPMDNVRWEMRLFGPGS